MLPDWVSDAADMVVGWCALLGSGATGRTAHALECGSAGLAAAVLLCSTPGSAAQFLARHGVLLLADVLTWPRAPATFMRHALAACLLCVLSCGALGCEAVLGWWKPARGLACEFKVGRLSRSLMVHDLEQAVNCRISQLACSDFADRPPWYPTTAGRGCCT